MGSKSIVLKVHERKDTGKGNARRARRSGKIPCVIYGHGQQAKNMYVEENDWKNIPVKDIHIVELNFSEGAINALIKDIQFDYLKGSTVHIDFQEIAMDELVKAEVPIHAKGIPVGISQGGFLEQVMHEIEVESLPGDIPSFIEVDISALELDQSLHVRDLSTPEGVKFISPANLTVFHVLIPKVEEEPVAGAVEGAEGVEGAPAEPEVITAKPEKEEDEEVTEGKGKEKK